MTYDGDTVRFTSWRSRRLSRRNVLRTSGLGAAGLTAAALIGCGSDDEDTGGSGGTSGASGGGSAGSNVQTSGQSAAFERKGTLFLRDTPQTQDFHRHTGTMPSPSLVCDTPTAIDASGATQLFLLDAMEAPDAANYTFTFKPGVKFHNGRGMTAEDVRLNFERIRATDGAWMKGTADGISSIETPDEQTVVVTLDEPYSPMLSLLSEMWIMAPESPGWDGTITEPIGTGPFAWKQWIPNDRIDLEAHTEYWQPNRPAISAIQVKNLEGDPIPALLAGDVHISGITVTQRALVEGNPDVNLQLEKATSWEFLSFNNRSPRAPFDDLRVRRAIGHALDKAALNEFANGDTGMVADQMAPPNSFYWSDQIVDPFATPNLAEARKLLAAAGVGDLRAVMPVNSTPAKPEVVAAQLREIGVECDLQVADDVTTETRLQSYDWDLYFAGSGTRSDIALRFVRMMSDGPNPGLWGGPQNADYDRLVKEAWAEVDAEARKAKYLEAWQVVMDNLFTIVAYHRAGLTASRKEVVGWETGAMANFNRIDGGVSHITLA
ncbi:MAG: ABC transporter substrate-binding protein [Dehalococcoidia bacterium]|nr:ABC transporter substrate-binding protein [Dehalococcoidia bacterium]